MVIEAGVVAGYVIACAVRKARRVVARLDVEADAVIDEGLDRLHEVVAAKLGGHLVLEEQGEATVGGGRVSELTCQQVELTFAMAANKDQAFGQAITELVACLRQAEQANGRPVVAGAAVFIGGRTCRSRRRGIAFGQVAGDVHLDQDQDQGTLPGRGGLATDRTRHPPGRLILALGLCCPVPTSVSRPGNHRSGTPRTPRGKPAGPVHVQGRDGGLAVGAAGQLDVYQGSPRRSSRAA